MKKKEIILVLVIFVIVAIGIFFILKYTGFAARDYETSLLRSASDATRRGSNLTQVYVRISVYSIDHSLGISEKIPEGFRVTSFSREGVLTGERIEWLIVPGRNTGVYYTLEPVEDIKTLNFSGEWYSDTGEGEIFGSSSLTIN